MSSDSAPLAPGNFDPMEELEASLKFTTADALDIEADASEPPEEVWGGLRLAPGQLMEIIGGSGLGKSRMMLNLAINQVLGLDFAGLPVCGRPLNWLFYGNENNLYRFRTDLRNMLRPLSAEQRERLRGRIFLPTMAQSMDAFVSLQSETNRMKLKTTIQYRNADVVVFDPWGAVIDGDELDDGDVRRTIIEIVDILAAIKDKPTVGIILNHSRNGAKELADADGFSAANYGKNSKAIFSVVRNVWNLRPAHFASPVTKIELINAKASDSQPYEPRAVDFDPETFTYKLDESFDHVVWQHELERAKRSGSAMSTSQRADATARKQDEMERKILQHLSSCGPIYKKELETWMKGENMPKNMSEAVFSALLASRKIAKATERLTNRVLVGSPSAIFELLDNASPNTYREMGIS